MKKYNVSAQNKLTGKVLSIEIAAINMVLAISAAYKEFDKEFSCYQIITCFLNKEFLYK